MVFWLSCLCSGFESQADSKVVEHKACLCAQGFTQSPGIDYEKTYLPTSRFNLLRTLIAFAATNSLSFHQIDVKSAFLNAPLKETVYLSIPQGLNLTKDRQSLLFHRRGDHPVWLYIHVDDIAIFGKDTSFFKSEISRELAIKDIGPANLILGVKFTQSPGEICLDQYHFTDSLLFYYGMQECRPVSTPLLPNKNFSPATEEEATELKKLSVNYQSTISSINYLSTATRPNLLHAVSSLSQFLESPGIKHWQGFLHVLRYLHGSPNLFLVYSRNCHHGITAYSNVDWGNCQVTRRLVTGYLALFNNCVVLWKTRKQPTVSLSTAEAEYKALCDLTSEILWLRQWAQECAILHLTTPIPIYEDNQSCIKVANGNCNINNKRMKHTTIIPPYKPTPLPESERIIPLPALSTFLSFLLFPTFCLLFSTHSFLSFPISSLLSLSILCCSTLIQFDHCVQYLS
ncbi:hypothetical protein O181_024634 [Austropuccinia psidii MF-1]|uniref:Reverse transcriptase Ty1/copia-type domain-containing protein n=1 Tax=Austropuccinia psidii MF-1 TaxID=1389203 RepID=A0A9Q3CGK8_9BASI|nr:hypothetical protein [Austropuccinia psidii MF-1]